MNIDTFERVEKKYLINSNQLERLLEIAQEHIKMDQYGLHTISNIYYDTNNDECIRWSLQKPEYKEKLRIRTYQAESKNPEVFVEIKKKFDGVVYKRRISTTTREAYRLCAGYKKQGCTQIRKEIEYFAEFYQPVPKAYLAYDRVAYQGLHEDLRITFDRNIRYRYEDLSLKASKKDHLLMKPQEVLMEIKVSKSIPFWLSRALAQLEIFPISYSKYGKVYEETLNQNRSEDLPCLPVYSTLLQEV